MKLFMKKSIYLFFFLLVSADIVGIYLKIDALHFICKPMLMPALLLSVLLFCEKSRNRTYILLALFFSFLGDVLLLFEQQQPVFFIPGLLFFLLAHIFYILYFFLQYKPGKNPKKTSPFIKILIALYITWLLYFLFPGLGDLMIPVIIYACVISMMLFSSIYTTVNAEKHVRFLFIAGAVCFVISDSILAINKFYKPFSLGPVFIMLTYAAAQYNLVKAFIDNNKSQ